MFPKVPLITHAALQPYQCASRNRPKALCFQWPIIPSQLWWFSVNQQKRLFRFFSDVLYNMNPDGKTHIIGVILG